MAVTLLLPFAFLWITRIFPKNRFPEYFLAVAIMGGEIAYISLKIIHGLFDLRYHLPLQLCDLAAASVVLAIFSHRKIFFELAFFWGLTGTLQAILTPDLQHDFPHPDFLVFFMMHSGIVAGVLFLAISGKKCIRPGSAIRVFLLSQIYIGGMIPLNFLLEANYGYLTHKPFRGTLMEYLGPWPWYILSFELAAILLFRGLEYLYFRLRGIPLRPMD